MPDCRVEVLIPTFKVWKNHAHRPRRQANVLNHNTKPFRVSIEQCAREPATSARSICWPMQAMDPATVTKSGVMVGIGEETGELIEVFVTWARAGSIF